MFLYKYRFGLNMFNKLKDALNINHLNYRKCILDETQKNTHVEVYQFCRIQKTGGTSFIQHLNDMFPKQIICPIYFDYELNNINPFEFKVFTGHISLNSLYQYYTKVNHIFLLRSPIERIISSFFYWKKYATELKEHSKFFEEVEKLNFLQFLTSESSLIRNSVFNVQARLLAGGKFGSSNHSRTCVFGPNFNDNFIIDSAIENLKCAYMVGLTEHMNESVSRLTRKISGSKRNLIKTTYHLNKTHNRPSVEQLTNKEYEAIEKNIYLDQLVYDFVLDYYFKDTST